MSRRQRLWQALEKVTTLALLGAALTVIWASVPFGRSQTPRGATPRVEEIQAVLPPDVLSGVTVKGDPSAKIAIVEFSDYQCPFCGRSARDTHPQLQRDFIDTKIARYAFVNFPIDAIHPHARKAAEAAECAGRQGKYWPMHQQLFAHQQALEETNLVEYGSRIGLSPQRFISCLAGSTTQEIDKDVELGRTYGVNSTPTFFIGELRSNGAINVRRVMKGAQPYSAFKTVVDELLRLKNS